MLVPCRAASAMQRNAVFIASPLGMPRLFNSLGFISHSSNAYFVDLSSDLAGLDFHGSRNWRMIVDVGGGVTGEGEGGESAALSQGHGQQQLIGQVPAHGRIRIGQVLPGFIHGQVRHLFRARFRCPKLVNSSVMFSRSMASITTFPGLAARSSVAHRQLGLRPIQSPRHLLQFPPGDVSRERRTTKAVA